jgi:rare lipoprotein A
MVMVEVADVMMRWKSKVTAITILAGAIAGCATHPELRPPAPAAPAQVPPSAPTQVGVASWYGPGFDHHRTSNGEIYNQEDLTAASEVFPLGSRVMVTNLDNGRSVEVTVNDHGPFKKGRKIDLSHRAAEVIGMIGPGTAPVKIRLLSKPDGSRAVGTTPQYFVQLGAFSDRQNAERLLAKASRTFPDVTIQQVDSHGARFYRVRSGSMATRTDAEQRAADSTRFGLPVVIVNE